MPDADPAQLWEFRRREDRLRRHVEAQEAQLRRLRRHDEEARRALRRREDEDRRLGRRLDDVARRREQADRSLQRRVDDLGRRQGGSGWVGPADRRVQEIDDRLLVWAPPLAAGLALPLVVGHLSTFVVSGDVPRYPLGEAPGILWRLPGHLGSPGQAWEPVNTGAQVAGPVAWWGTFVVLALALAGVGLLLWSMRQRSRPGGGRSWAPALAHRRLWVTGNQRDRLVVGTAAGRRIALRDRHSLLVVGSAHTGKTAGLSVPAVLEWPGPVVVAAAKGHLVDDTIGWRSTRGDVHVYDPAGVTRYHRSGWSLLADCATWPGAIRTAADLTLATLASTGPGRNAEGVAGESQADLWPTPMAMALAPYLLATVASGRSVAATAEWLGREERDDVLAILDGVDRTAARAHETTFARPDTARSAFLQAMHQVLSVYEDPVVEESMDRHDIVPEELLDGGAHALYLTAPEHDQERFRPLCATILRKVLSAAYEQSARTGAALATPLLVVLDDVPGVAPVYDLASLASTAPGRGVQLLSVVQDLARIREQYGDAADRLVASHGARLIVSGSHTRPSEPTLVEPALVDELGSWEAALVYGTGAPTRVRLRPWFRDRRLRRLVNTPQDRVHGAPPDIPPGPVAPDEQTSAWLRRSTGGVGGEAGGPTAPIGLHPGHRDVFGSLGEDDTPPQGVPRIPDRRRDPR